jgi:hypothetical protein
MNTEASSNCTKRSAEAGNSKIVGHYQEIVRNQTQFMDCR